MGIIFAFVVGVAIGVIVAFWLLTRGDGGVRLPW